VVYVPAPPTVRLLTLVEWCFFLNG
jgi:hypothetical protein